MANTMVPVWFRKSIIYSSNIRHREDGLEVALMAIRNSCRALGPDGRLRTELPESADPQQPSKWSQIKRHDHFVWSSASRLTYAEGGFSSSLGQMVESYSTTASFHASKAEAELICKTWWFRSQETSDKMRYLNAPQLF